MTEHTAREPDIDRADIDEDDYADPRIGGCYLCYRGNGKQDDDMVFSTEFDAYYHPEHLPDDCDDLLEYIT